MNRLKRKKFLFERTLPHHAYMAWALMRVFMGVFLLCSAFNKLDTRFIHELTGQLKHFAQAHPVPIYQAFLLHGLIPNVATVAKIVAIGELLLGAALLIGFLTPVAAVGGVLMSLNYLLATAHLGISFLGLNLTWLVLFVGLFLSDAGQYYGVDGWLQSLQSRQPKKNPKERILFTHKNLPPKIEKTPVRAGKRNVALFEDEKLHSWRFEGEEEE